MVLLEERVGDVATKSYVWSPVYVDAMVARDRDTDANGSLDERLYVTHDANFNVTGLVTTGGTVVERYTYDPYGVAQVRDGSWTTTTTAYVWQYLHQGGRLSGESGLYAFRFREYSPTLGRWASNDPIQEMTNSQNSYVANYNNPLLYTDCSGLSPVFGAINAAINSFLAIDFSTVSQTGSNCWFAATIISYAYQRPKEISNKIFLLLNDMNTTAKVSLYSKVTLKGSSTLVTATSRVSVSYADMMKEQIQSNGLWARALAAGLTKINVHTGHGPGIGDLFFKDVLYALTGNGYSSTYNPTGLIGLNHEFIQDRLDRKKIVVANTLSPSAPWLVSTHAYALVKYYKDGDAAKRDNPDLQGWCGEPYYVLINPWGHNPATMPAKHKANESRFGPGALLLTKSELDKYIFHVQAEK